MATTRTVSRIAASLGLGTSPIQFESHQSLANAGVLFLLPALLSHGLLKTKDFYTLSTNVYYELESIVLTLAMMYLCRIKNPEQLKQCKVGELGRIIGLDRIPETRCLRKNIRLMAEFEQASALNDALAQQWFEGNEDGLLYIDGHTRVYHGHKANLPVKYISRQKLCLSATTDFWVHEGSGLPLMMVSGELTEKLQEAIEGSILPRLKEANVLAPLPKDENTPRCTLVFDREAYKPSFFAELWKKERIAVITYRKNVKDLWDENDFNPVEITQQQKVIMHLCEKEITLSDHSFREIRKRSKNQHQTAIITTHPTLELQQIAVAMFSRWTQENFFKYMIADYNLDAMADYGIEEIDPNKKVVNPPYRKLSQQLKKQREKKARLEAKFYPLVKQINDKNIDQLPKLTPELAHVKEQITELEQNIDQLLSERKEVPCKISLDQMPEQTRYNKLKNESTLLLNVIKMICYRAETSMANLLPQTLEEEKRMVIKQVIMQSANITPDYSKKVLKVTLLALSANRFNQAIADLCQTLNETQTVFPGTDLVMVFETTPMVEEA